MREIASHRERPLYESFSACGEVNLGFGREGGRRAYENEGESWWYSVICMSPSRFMNESAHR